MSGTPGDGAVLSGLDQSIFCRGPDRLVSEKGRLGTKTIGVSGRLRSIGLLRPGPVGGLGITVALIATIGASTAIGSGDCLLGLSTVRCCLGGLVASIASLTAIASLATIATLATIASLATIANLATVASLATIASLASGISGTSVRLLVALAGLTSFSAET